MLTKLIRTLFALCLLAPSFLIADLRIVLDVTQDTEPARSSTRAKSEDPSTRQFRMEVILGSRQIEVNDDQYRRIIDFQGNTLYTIKTNETTYRAENLFAVVSFRQQELRNRIRLSSAIDAGGVQSNPMERTTSEHIFSMRGPEPKSIAAEHSGNSITYSNRGKILYSADIGGYKMSNSEAAMFVTFLRYLYPAHPDILDALQKSALLPRKFEIHHYGLNTNHYQFTFVKAENIKHAFSAAKAIEGRTTPPSTLIDLCTKTTAEVPSRFAAECARLKAVAIEQGEAKQYLNCLMTFLEISLCDGAPFPKEFAKYQDAIVLDADCKILLGSIKPRNKEEAEKAITDLRALREKNKDFSRVLKSFEANTLSLMGQRTEAKKLFFELLNENPCVVGAWKDIGDLYFTDYDTITAWQLWDTARSVFPGHPLLQPIEAFENRLVTEFPGYL